MHTMALTWARMTHNKSMIQEKRVRFTSLERLERQVQDISGDRAQGDAGEKALKGWINAGGHPELTKAWMWGEWRRLRSGHGESTSSDRIPLARQARL